MRELSKYFFSALCFASFSSTPYALTGHGVASLFGGVADISFNNLHLPVSSIERDTLHQTNNSSTFIGGIGLGYDLTFKSRCKFRINDLLIGLNWYNANFENNGVVYQFGESSLNNFNYKMPINTSRLMLDGKVFFGGLNNFMPYIVGGVGMSWNRIQYHDIATTSGATEIALPRREQLKFAYEAGVGVQTSITKCVAIFAEYLYANLGTIKTATNGNVVLVSSAVVPLHVNSGLAGLSYSFN